MSGSRRAFPVPAFGDVPVVLASLAACSLALSPGPLRGLAIVGWRRACLMIAGLSAGFGFPSIVQLVDPAAPIGRSCLPPAGRPGDRGRGRRHVRTQPRGPAGRGAGSDRAPAQSRRHHPPARRSTAASGALARQPARRRAGVAGGDRLLAGAGRAGIARGLGPGQACPASAETSRAIAWGISGRVGWPRLTCARTRNMAVFAQVKTRREYLSGCGVVASR